MKRVLSFGFLLYLILLLITRFYNIPYTARFTEDESGFLVRTHQIFVEKKITLVGQINDTGTKVFSSSTVYLLMPFAFLGNFSPESVFYGAAFWGVVTAVSMYFLGLRVHKKYSMLISVLTIVWFPLLETGRWAWNPNLIPLFVGLGLLSYFSKHPLMYFLSGVFFGLSVHQHYYALFAAVLFIGYVSFQALLKREIGKTVAINFGFFLMLLPFIVFDLRHPPGIFLLGASGQAQNFQLTSFLPTLAYYISKTGTYFTQSLVLAVLLGVLSALLLYFDVKNKRRALLFFFVPLGHIILLALLTPYYHHYFFPVIPFFYVWIVYKRDSWGGKLAKAIILILIVGSLSRLIPHLTKAPVVPDLPTVSKISQIIHRELASGDLKNNNISVLASPDANTFGKKYRDLLLVYDNTHLLTPDEYPITDNLFVISTASEDILRKDPAYEMTNFRSGIVKKVWRVDNWSIYLFTK